MLEVEDEGDSVEFGGGGEGRDFAIRPIKRKIHKGVKGKRAAAGRGAEGWRETEKSGGAQGRTAAGRQPQAQAGRMRMTHSLTVNVRNRPLLLTYSK